jgi:hypothetical protein
MWEGGDVYIIGGGPSVPSQFDIPQSIINRVIAGESPSLYSPYMEPIHDKHVIGVNTAFLIGDWIDLCFFGDKGFFKKYKEQLAKFSGLKVTCQGAYRSEGIRWVKVLQKNPKKLEGISSHPTTVCWNSNSGAAAISVAANAGAARIILLGFDMKLSDDGCQWWHTIYTGGAKARKKQPFERHLRGFDAIARDAKRRKIEIINASPKSAIKQFRRVNVKDIV